MKQVTIANQHSIIAKVANGSKPSTKFIISTEHKHPLISCLHGVTSTGIYCK